MSKLTITLEDVFVRKLQSDPLHVLELAREFLEQGPCEGTYAKQIIDKYILAWMDENEDNEEQDLEAALKLLLEAAPNLKDLTISVGPDGSVVVNYTTREMRIVETGRSLKIR